MRVATAWSKLMPVLTADDARDMYSRDTIVTFRVEEEVEDWRVLGASSPLAPHHFDCPY
jgi:hypothetical protein